MPDYTSTMAGASAPAPKDGHTPDGRQILRNPDGTIEVTGEAGEDPGPRIPKEGDFDENLAGFLSRQERIGISQELIEYRDIDKTSRKDWEEREQRALEMLGIKDIPRDDPRKRGPGLHDIVHPVLATACVQFQARAIAEFFPPAGPVKGDVIGKATQALEEQAERIETFMNYYLTEVDKGYFDDMDQMLFYLPMAGCAFKKVMPDWRTNLPQLRYVKGTNFVAPYAGTSLDTMPRYAHEYTMTGQDISRGMAIGTLYDTILSRPAEGQAKHSRTADTADLREPILHQDDELYPMIEYHVEMALDSPEISPQERGIILPWVIMVEETNHEVLLVRRNWRANDTKRMKRLWFSRYNFLPGLGFYGFGFPHIIGSLGRGASGVVNSLLDSATASNFPGGFIAKEGKGQLAGEITMEPGVFKDIDLPAEDLAKAFFRPEVGKPEPALFQLLEHFVQAAEKFTQTTDVNVGQADNKGPVGTTVALIEESSRVQTAIHKRMHVSAKEEFRMLAEYISEYMPSTYTYDLHAETRFLLKTDFNGRVDIRPVSDPNIFSSTQRIALAQAVVELQGQAPDLYSRAKRVAAHMRLLQALRVPSPDEVGPDEDQTPQLLDPISENQMMALQSPVQVFFTQDDDAHILIHKNFLEHMQTTLDPQPYQQLWGLVQAHLADHGASKYRKEIMQQVGMELPPFDPHQPNAPLPPDIERGVSVLASRHLAPPQQAPGAANGTSEDAQAQAEIQRKDALAHAELERKTTQFVAEEHRKQTGHLAEQRRKDQAAAAGVVRDRAKHVVATHHAHLEGNLRKADVMEELRAKEAQRRLQARSLQDQRVHEAQTREQDLKAAKAKAAIKPKVKLAIKSTRKSK